MFDYHVIGLWSPIIGYDEEGDQPSGSVILYCTKPNEQDKAAGNVQKWMQIELSKTLN